MADAETSPLTDADREKRRVALTSLLAAVVLTTLKLVVGLLTGSLGILSEAAHSGLDLVAAAMTYFAVRVSSRPADQDHPYGHGKVENLSALFETLLLLVTCVWIIWEAVQRLFYKSVKIDITVWAFAVMVLSIVIDVSRSRALGRVAKKYDSQALEADALHFSTDVYSSAVVLLGLGLVVLAQQLRQPWLVKADAGAALAVAAIVVVVSMQLGRRTVAALLDAVPASLIEDVARAVQVDGVAEVKKVRLRRSGPEAFADVTLAVPRDTSFERAHAIATAAEDAVRGLLPGADVVVHVDPVHTAGEGVLAKVRILAARHGLGAHAIRMVEVRGTSTLELHLEVDDRLSVAAAHEKATTLERELHAALPGIDRIVTHLEPVGEASAICRAAPVSEGRVLEALRALAAEGLDCEAHDVVVHQVDGELTVAFHCAIQPGAAITDAHALTERLERELRTRVPEVARVVIHVEPPEPEDPGPPAPEDPGPPTPTT